METDGGSGGTLVLRVFRPTVRHLLLHFDLEMLLNLPSQQVAKLNSENRPDHNIDLILYNHSRTVDTLDDTESKA
jgi:hypothetical protein